MACYIWTTRKENRIHSRTNRERSVPTPPTTKAIELKRMHVIRKHRKRSIFLPPRFYCFRLTNVRKLIRLLSQYLPANRNDPLKRANQRFQSCIQTNIMQNDAYQLRSLLSLNESSTRHNDWIDSVNISFEHWPSSINWTGCVWSHTHTATYECVGKRANKHCEMTH